MIDLRARVFLGPLIFMTTVVLLNLIQVSMVMDKESSHLFRMSDIVSSSSCATYNSLNAFASLSHNFPSSITIFAALSQGFAPLSQISQKHTNMQHQLCAEIQICCINFAQNFKDKKSRRSSLVRSMGLCLSNQVQ